MLEFEWNALRVGDRVLVHDAGDPGAVLIPGVVATFSAIDGSSRRRRSGRANSVGIRLATPGGTGAVIICPARLAVHRDPREAEPCWRCEALAGAA